GAELCRAASVVARMSSSGSGSTARSASGFLERQALDVGHVGALDADQLCRAFAARGVDVALVVDVGVAGLERIAARVLHLAGLGLGRGLEHRAVAHDCLAARLAVDGPRRAVIVRLALLRARVVVREDAEAERRVFVEDLPLGDVVADVLGDEGVVLQHLLNDGADLLPPGRPRGALEDAAALGCELLEGHAHGPTSVRSCYPTGWDTVGHGT